MRKYIITILIFIFLTFSLFPITIIPSSWNLGTISGDTGIQTLKLKVFNETLVNVKIDFISTCDCLWTDTETLILSPDESAVVNFSFNPKDENGQVSKFMIIRTTQPGLPKALFEVQGEVLGNIIETETEVSDGELDTVNTDTDLSSTFKVIPIKYYYSAGCISCIKFLEQTIPELEEKSGLNIEVEKLDIMNPDIYEDYFSRLKPEELEIIKFPALFIGDKLLQGDKAIAKNLEKEVLNYSGNTRIAEDSGLLGKISVSLIPVLLAGLLDGINPCVFTTLLFLVSSLTLVGRGRKEILIIGIFFTLAVFVTYYLVGLGLFQGLRAASIFPIIADIIKWTLIFFLLLISVLSFYDYIQIRHGRAAKISLQLPKFLKLRIHGVIREQSKSSSIIIGSLVLGLMVSVFELACTGQVYFPTIAYLVSMGKSSAYLYLLLYNISFIIPLLVVFILIYKGTGSKVITGFFQRNMGVMKISLSLLFIILAGIVFLL